MPKMKNRKPLVAPLAANLGVGRLQNIVMRDKLMEETETS